MSIDRVINGILKYLDREIFVHMNQWQEISARILITRLLNTVNGVKRELINNSYLRTFAILDENGNVDVEGLANDLKSQIEAKNETLEISIPMFGTFKFTAQDVDKLRNTILEG